MSSLFRDKGLYHSRHSRQRELCAYIGSPCSPSDKRALCTWQTCVTAEKPQVWETPNILKQLLVNLPNPFPTGEYYLFIFIRKQICPLLPGMTLSLSSKTVCYTNILQNAILDKSCHKCVETPWRIASQQVFSSLPLDPLSKGPKQRYSIIKVIHFLGF